VLAKFGPIDDKFVNSAARCGSSNFTLLQDHFRDTNKPRYYEPVRKTSVFGETGEVCFTNEHYEFTGRAEAKHRRNEEGNTNTKEQRSKRKGKKIKVYEVKNHGSYTRSRLSNNGTNNASSMPFIMLDSSGKERLSKLISSKRAESERL